MDFDDLDEEEQARGDELRPELSGPARPPEERPYGLVVYGATGFTGRLIAQHINALFQAPGATAHPWALAGRSAEPLAAVARLCDTGPGVLVVETAEEVEAMVAQCRVIILAAGPFNKTGQPVIKSCVAHGTHYVDISGENWWLKQMIDLYEKEARAKGVILVSMCAMQSVPSELCVNMLARHLGPLSQARGYMVQFGFTTGGTDATGRSTMEALIEDPFLLKDVNDPFILGGRRRGERRDVDEDCTHAEEDTLFPKLWLGALGCAAVDSRAVRRTCMLLEKRGGHKLRYGDDFSFVLREPCSNKAAAERTVQNVGPLQDADHAKPALEMMLQGVKAGLSPPPGAGPPEDARAQFYTKLIMVAESEDGQWATCSYRGGENYEVTAMCAVAGALTLLEELESLRPAERGGFLTPGFAFAFGDADDKGQQGKKGTGTGFLERLQKHRWSLKATGASMSFDIKDGKPEEASIKELVAARTKHFAVFQGEVARGDMRQW